MVNFVFHNKSRIIIIIILLLAFILRVYKISEIPPALSWDEVSIGYNAYGILKTGFDEHGRLFPLDTFTAYGDYKPPLSIYITVPFVWIFGLNELAVRLPSALFGTLTVLLTVILVRQLLLFFGKFKSKQKNNFYQEFLPYVSAFLLAISPWHINLSRAGFEANIALFWVILGIILFFKSFSKPKILGIVWLPFVGAIYTFNSARYFVLILGAGLVFLGYKMFIKHKKEFVIGVFLSLLLLTPIMPHLFSKEAQLRFTEVNIFSDSEIVKTANDRIEAGGGGLIFRVFNNRRVGFARSYLIHFFDHLQPSFLFIKGDGNPKFSIQDTGQMYLIEAPFLVLGVISLFACCLQLGLFLIFWLLSAIAPAAVARETPHALRTLNSLPVWQIFTAFGVLKLISLMKQKYKNIFIPTALFTLIILGFLANFVFYLHNYYIHYPREFSGEWQYGYKQALEFTESIKDNYQNIYITDAIGRPYMYTLFYTKYDPVKFRDQKLSYFDQAGFYHVDGFGRYEFVKTMPDESSGSALCVADYKEVPQETNILTTVNLPDGKPKLVIYEL